MTTSPHRSEVFAFASDIVDRDAEADPLLATEWGVKGFDHLLPDFSRHRADADLALVRDELAGIARLRVADDVDRIALAVMHERLTSRLGLLESGEKRRIFTVIDSPVANIRQVFELMDCQSADDLDTIAARLRQVRPALESWRDCLEFLAGCGELPSRRHVVGVAGQARTHSAGDYSSFVRRVSLGLGESGELTSAALDAEAACGELASWMDESLAPRAGEHDAVGLDRYRAWSKSWTGATLDFDELYEWGYEDLRRINHRMREVANQLVPGSTNLVEVAEHLDHDVARKIDGTDELLRRLVAVTEGAVGRLDGVQFDIDPRIRFCDVRVAPEGSAAAAYYIPPSEDLSRPGTTWYPTLGSTTFYWWRQASTWYHEGVPGHHLQCATSIIEAERQSRYHRLEAWTSGYGEGWALYAERLVDELGFFEEPGEEMGFLHGQALRAARVVVDIGLHLELPAPSDLGTLRGLGDCSGRVWTAEMAVALLEERALDEHASAVSEVDRYLGLPAQAISYKVGERVWLRSREEARTRLGDDFSLKRFHAYALALGPMGLDPFEAEMRQWDGQ